MGSELASRWARFSACVVDGVAFSIAFAFVEAGTFSNRGGLVAFGVLLLLGQLAADVFLLTVMGQTIGKIVLGIRIVRADTGEAPGFVRGVLLRSVVNSVLSVIPFYSLVDPLTIFRDDRRCLHDMLAGTVVVRS